MKRRRAVEHHTAEGQEPAKQTQGCEEQANVGGLAGLVRFL